jgi:VIT1/CCC1 family predicted Fe2+/Mn2+ transporter
MADNSTHSRKRLLDPMERVSEILFGLIMVLTFTCSFSVASADRRDVYKMMLAALGCNVAWGIIDGVFYLMSCLSEQGHNILALRAVRKTADSGEAHRIIAKALPTALAAALSEAEFAVLREKLNRLSDPPAHPRLAKDDWLAAFGVFLLVFLSTFPVVIPFLFIREPRLALRASNGVAIVMLFMAGCAFGRYSGFRPGRVGLAMVVLGIAMVGLTIVFGG